MADKLSRQEAMKKNKKGKKGKKGKSGKSKGPKLGAKEQAALEAKHKKEEEERTKRKIEEQDRARRWSENHIYMLIKPEGFGNLNSFVSRPSQPVIETPKKSFAYPMPKLSPFENSVVKNEDIRSGIQQPILTLPPILGQRLPQQAR